jgi:hypothetical protein
MLSAHDALMTIIPMISDRNMPRCSSISGQCRQFLYDPPLNLPQRSADCVPEQQLAFNILSTPLHVSFTSLSQPFQLERRRDRDV